MFSIDDLAAAKGRTTGWDGVRNHQAKITLRDHVKKGDLVLFYHSSADPPGAAGIAEIVREGYPDPTQFDPASDHFDAAASRESPVWIAVDVRLVRKFARIVTLAEIRAHPGLAKMDLLRRGNRLSVQPVAPAEFEIVEALGASAGR